MSERETHRQFPIDDNVRIGHVHLKVADLERALDFYSDVLGFHITQRYGEQAAFVAAGDYHHQIGLNTWESAGGSPPPRGCTGLYHLAILYPSRPLLADALRRLEEAGVGLDGASDHGVSEAVYLRDPDGNGLELYWDKPRELWPISPDGRLQMYSRPLDLEDLRSETQEEAPRRSPEKLKALDRWENEGGAAPPPEYNRASNPEEMHAPGDR